MDELELNEKIAVFFLKHGLKLLILGFSISAIGCMVMFMQAQQQHSLSENFGFGITIAGFAIYGVSRVAMIYFRRQMPRNGIHAGDEIDEKEGL